MVRGYGGCAPRSDVFVGTHLASRSNLSEVENVELRASERFERSERSNDLLHALRFNHREQPVLRIAVERPIRPRCTHHTGGAVIIEAEQEMSDFMRHHPAEKRARIDASARRRDAVAIAEHG